MARPHEEQNVLPALGVLWFVVGLLLIGRETPDQAVRGGACHAPSWAQLVMGGCVVAMSGIAVWRRERWPSKVWLGLLIGLAVAFVVMYVGVAPRLRQVCEN